MKRRSTCPNCDAIQDFPPICESNRKKIHRKKKQIDRRCLFFASEENNRKNLLNVQVVKYAKSKINKKKKYRANPKPSPCFAAVNNESLWCEMLREVIDQIEWSERGSATSGGAREKLHPLNVCIISAKSKCSSRRAYHKCWIIYSLCCEQFFSACTERRSVKQARDMTNVV